MCMSLETEQFGCAQVTTRNSWRASPGEDAVPSSSMSSYRPLHGNPWREYIISLDLHHALGFSVVCCSRLSCMNPHDALSHMETQLIRAAEHAEKMIMR